MVTGQILGLLVNTPEYMSYICNDFTKTSPFGKFALWYVCTFVGIISSVCAAVGL